MFDSPSPSPPQLTHSPSPALVLALDSRADDMPPDLQDPPPRGYSHLARMTDKPLINLLSIYPLIPTHRTPARAARQLAHPGTPRVQRRRTSRYALARNPEILGRCGPHATHHSMHSGWGACHSSQTVRMSQGTLCTRQKASPETRGDAHATVASGCRVGARMLNAAKQCESSRYVLCSLRVC